MMPPRARPASPCCAPPCWPSRLRPGLRAQLLGLCGGRPALYRPAGGRAGADASGGRGPQSRRRHRPRHPGGRHPARRRRRRPGSPWPRPRPASPRPRPPASGRRRSPFSKPASGGRKPPSTSRASSWTARRPWCPRARPPRPISTPPSTHTTRTRPAWTRSAAASTPPASPPATRTSPPPPPACAPPRPMRTPPTSASPPHPHRPQDGTVQTLYYRRGELVPEGRRWCRCCRQASSRCASSCPSRNWPDQARPAGGGELRRLPAAGGRHLLHLRQRRIYPPVIYSREERAKLVYQVEARPRDPPPRGRASRSPSP